MDNLNKFCTLQEIVATLQRQVSSSAITQAEADSMLTVALRGGDFLTEESSNGSDKTATYLERQVENTIHPWKLQRERAMAFWSERSKATMKERMKKFETLAKNKALPSHTVLVCMYLLYAKDEHQGVLNLLDLLLYGPTGKQTTLHNWQVFEGMPTGDKATFGEIIEKFPVPLYPPSTELAFLNDQLRDCLNNQGGALEGGSNQDVFQSFYRPNREFFEGGSYSEAVYNSKGEQIAAVDMTNTYNLMQNLSNITHHAYTQLQQQLQNSNGRGRGGGGDFGRGNGRGGGRGGRGGKGGRGGNHGPWNLQGGEPTTETPQENPAQPAPKN
ncbi:hypothetical protein NESM_000448800 [Novymonas esmeraldas]|uniref:Uncharacterized protein n=1 Tax=Novymonas esmeraldas TaxID=1808958 RepID=A0AAW0EPW2_9TRYP